MYHFQNYIIKEIPFNISDTYFDISAINRVITRSSLIFESCSLFNIQILYPLFSDLTYSPAQIKQCFNKQNFTKEIYFKSGVYQDISIKHQVSKFEYIENNLNHWC